MGRKRSMRMPDGRDAMAEEMTFRSPGENWSEYLTDDGSVIRIKPVVMEIFKIEGEYDQQGNPVYFINAQQVMVVSAPDELRKSE